MYHLLTGTISAILRDRKGISAMEYAILAAAVLGAVGGAVSALGTDMKAMIDALASLIVHYTPTVPS